MPMRYLVVVSLLISQIAFGQRIPSLVKDINIKNNPSTSSNPIIEIDRAAPYVGTILYKNELYFSADDGIHGREFWKTDGTSKGTVLLKDINPGPEPSTDGYNFSMMSVVNGKLLFVADDGVHGPTLWKTDGTASGTLLLDDLVPDEKPGMIPLSNDKMFLLAQHPDVETSRNLYFSDATPAGTTFLGTFKQMEMVATLSDRIFFYEADHTAQTFDLWISDGTIEGTVRIMNDSPLGTVLLTPSAVERVFKYKAHYYFITAKTQVMYKTDGTEEGTEPVFAFPPGYSYGTLQEVHDEVYISRLEDGAIGTLWRTDGTNEGTHLVNEIYGALCNKIVPFGNEMLLWIVYGDLTTPARDKELWKSNGTPEGTSLLKHLGNYQTGGGLFDTDGAILNEQYIFESKDAEHGLELWTTDGTEEGTHLYMDLLPGEESSQISNFTETSEGIYFTALDTDGKHQLWKLMNECPAKQLTTGIDLGGFQVFDNNFLLSAFTDVTGYEVFYYDASHDGSGCSPIEQDLTNAISIYPNPVESKTLHFESELTFSWSIQDLTGRVMLKGQKQEYEGTIDVSSLNTGQYIVTMITARGVTSGKVVVR